MNMERRCLEWGYGFFFLILGMGCFYFSIFENLFAIFFPDELNVSNILQTGGFFFCVKQYYLHTTINRLSADMAVCSVAQIPHVLSDFFRAWVMSRFVLFLLLPISIGVFIKKIMGVASYVYSFAFAFIITALAFYMLQNFSEYYLYGLDLSIYAVATSTFILLLAFFPESMSDNKKFLLFIVLFAINLNSMEVFLVISGFFIPLFIGSNLDRGRDESEQSLFTQVVKKIKNKKFLMLSMVYIFSVLAVLLAPGYKMRQTIWPATGSFADGLFYVIFSLQDVFFEVLKSPFLIFLTFGFGMLARCFRVDMMSTISRWMCAYLSFAIVVYLIVTSYLLGITPSLQVGRHFPQEMIFVRHFIPTWKMGGFAIRQELFIDMGIYLNIFVFGFFMAEKMKINILIQHKVIAMLIALFMVGLVFYYHPNKSRGIDTLMRAFEYHIDKNNPFAQSKADVCFDRKKQNNNMFQKEYVDRTDCSLMNLAFVDYLRANRYHFIEKNPIHFLKTHTHKGYQTIFQPVWLNIILEKYKVLLKNSCYRFVASNDVDTSCWKNFSEKKAIILKLAKQSHALKAKSLDMIHTSGVIMKKVKMGHVSKIIDMPSDGEHFISTQVHLRQGFNYFSFHTMPTSAQVFVYIIGKNDSLLIPWLNMDTQIPLSFNENIQKMQLVYEQIEIPENNHLELIVYSPVDQSVTVRWQHAQNGVTIYNATELKASYFSKAQYTALGSLK